MEILLGIDIGSTTVKVVLLRGTEIIYRKYDRHYSKVREKTAEMLLEMGKFEELSDILKQGGIKVSVTGSAGLGLAKASGLDFVQEVKKKPRLKVLKRGRNFMFLKCYFKKW